MSKKLNKAMGVVLGVVVLWSMNATADERSFGPALKTLLTDDSYFPRYGIDNPNTELVQKLHAAGVRFYVCGQSVMFGGFEKEELVGPAKVALSAMTMMTELQSDGYALLR